MASVIAFRGRNAIIDLTSYNPIDDVTIPGITDTIRNLINKDYIVYIRLHSSDSAKGNLFPVITCLDVGKQFAYYDFINGSATAVTNDTFGGLG